MKGRIATLCLLVCAAAAVHPAVYSLGTSTLLVGPTAGSDSVVLAVSPATNGWTASTDTTWLHLADSSQGGTGSMNVIFGFGANPGATRSGTLTIAGQILTVTQAGSTYITAQTVNTLVSSGLNQPRGVALDGSWSGHQRSFLRFVPVHIVHPDRQSAVLLYGSFALD